MKPYRAACVFILRPQDRFVLAISRGSDTTDWGLPGGGVEDHETFEQGAARELFEETGVSLAPQTRLRKLFEGPSRRAYTQVFEPQGTLFWPEKLQSNPFEGYVAFVPLSFLISETSSFKKYNLEFFKKIGMIK